MNKQTKLILLVTFLIAVVQFTAVISLADKDTPRVKITPAVEVVNRHNDVARVGTQCPRTYSDSDPITAITAVADTEEGAEYQHCTQCRMGVYFRRPEGHLECSYCNRAHNG